MTDQFEVDKLQLLQQLDIQISECHDQKQRSTIGLSKVKNLEEDLLLLSKEKLEY